MRTRVAAVICTAPRRRCGLGSADSGALAGCAWRNVLLAVLLLLLRLLLLPRCACCDAKPAVRHCTMPAAPPLMAVSGVQASVLLEGYEKSP